MSEDRPRDHDGIDTAAEEADRDGAEERAEESAEERAAAWAAFTADPPPGDHDVHRSWVEGLSANPATPASARTHLLRRSTTLLRLLPADEAVEAALDHPDGGPRLRRELVEARRDLTPAHWARLIRAAGTERERWLLATLAASARVTLDAPTCALLAADPSTRVRAEAAALPGLPAEQAAALTADTDTGVRAAACRGAWPVLTRERRRALRADPAPAVRVAALLRHHEEQPLSRADFDALTRTGDGSADTTERAVAGCLLGPDLVEHLLTGGDARLRTTLAGNPRLAPEAVRRLAHDADAEVRHALALRGDLTEEQRAAIRVDIDPRTTSSTLEWVEELHGDPEAMRRLAASSHPLVRRSVARARRLPPDVAGRLAWDTDPVVQVFLAESCEDAPAEMLLRVWTWWTGSLSAPGRPRTHPAFPRDGLVRYADDPHGRMRCLALDDPESGPELVARFARDRDPEVRRRAARDPRLTGADATRLAEDPDGGVRSAALRHPGLPARVLARRLLDPDSARDAAANPGIPPAVLHAMASART
ncbi:PE-PGRS family protein [Streptomyces sp. NPDC048606]|uniref:PE-PGRS family protein n=1 Tax=Streptomyces sp. NPDC048606 TaxID=3154726 RepID=UPI00342734D8